MYTGGGEKESNPRGLSHKRESVTKTKKKAPSRGVGPKRTVGGVSQEKSKHHLKEMMPQGAGTPKLQK